MAGMTGVILTRRPWRHTDIQTDWYAGITDELIFQPLPLGCVVIDLILFIVLFCHLIIFVYKNRHTDNYCLYQLLSFFLFIESSHRQLLFIPVIVSFLFIPVIVFFLFIPVKDKFCLYQSVNLNVYISHQCPRGGERLVGR